MLVKGVQMVWEALPCYDGIATLYSRLTSKPFSLQQSGILTNGLLSNRPGLSYECVNKIWAYATKQIKQLVYIESRDRLV